MFRKYRLVLKSSCYLFMRIGFSCYICITLFRHSVSSFEGSIWYGEIYTVYTVFY